MTPSSQPARVRIVEVGPRDGLQNEARVLPLAEKVRFIDALASAGLPAIETTAFVRPDRVPQLADAADVVSAITRRPGTRFSALVPNLEGLSRAIDLGLDDVAIMVAASETFSRRNVNRSIRDALAQCEAVAARARTAGLGVRGYLSTAFGCPFEGPVAPSRVVDLADALVQFGVFEVAVSDTIGVAHPGQVLRVLDALGARLPVSALALHLHDTRGTALVNVYAALQHGVATFDASAGGLGGCPFAPGAAGNLATEDLVYLLDGLGIETGVRLAAVVDATRLVEPWLGHGVPSRYGQAARALPPPAPGD